MNDSILFDLIQEGNWDKLSKTIDQVSNQALFYKDEGTGNSLLHEACYWEVPDSIVAKLIARGLSPNEPNVDEESPVYLAALRNANPKLMEILLDEGGNPNRPNKLKESPVYAAAKKNVDIKLMQLLLGKGGDLTVTEKDGRTPVYIACLSRVDPNLLEVLLAAGGNPNTAEPLVSLCSGEAQNVQLTFDYQSGWTPLHVVAQGKDSDTRLMELLLDRGGDLNIPNKADAWTPLHIAAHNGASAEVVKLMLDFGANPKLVDKNGMTPTQLAEKKHHIHLLSLLRNPPLQTRWASNGSAPLFSSGGKSAKSPASAVSATRRLSFGLKSLVKSLVGNTASSEQDLISETNSLYDKAKIHFPGASVFHDINQRFELSALAEHVGRSKNIIIMLSKSYICRPYTLLELHHARVSPGPVNVIVVHVLKPGLERFDFKAVNADLQTGKVAQYVSDEDWNILKKNRIDVETMEEDIRFLLDQRAIGLNEEACSDERLAAQGNILKYVKS